MKTFKKLLVRFIEAYDRITALTIEDAGSYSFSGPVMCM